MNAAPAVPGTRLLSNSRWNLIAFAFALAAQFVTLPFVIRWIGLPAFGQAGLVLAIWAPLMLVGVVLGQATTRQVSMLGADADIGAASRVLASALWLCLAACALGGAALAAAGPLLLSALASEARPRAVLQLDFLVAGAGWAAQQIALVLQGATIARQDYRTVAQVAAFSSAATVALTLAFTSAAPTVEGYLCGVAASFVATMLAWLWVGRRGGRAPLALPRWHRSEALGLLHFGKWQSLAQLAGAFGNQIDRYALGVLAPAAVIGQYNAANRLQEAAYMGVMKGGEILFPHFGATSGAALAERQSFFVTSSWVVATLSVVFLAPLVPLSHSLLLLWAGAETADGGALLLRTLVLGGIVGCGSNVFSYYAMGVGENAPLAWLSVLYSLLTIVATVVLMRAFGPYAAGAGLLVASFGRVGAALWLTRRRFFPALPWSDLFISSVLPLAVGSTLALALHATTAGEFTSWASVVAGYVAVAAAVFLATLALTLPWRSGRAIVGRVVGALRHGHAA